ncbi:MAG TPA: hypothetical protein VFD41_00850 [Actinomycetales bacterium]|nr:hypothetical protein [Actinomycetales bacterium]
MGIQQSRQASEPAPRQGATWTVLTFSALATAVALYAGVRALLRAAGVIEIDLFAEVQGGAGAVGVFDEQQLRNSEGMFALIVLGVALVCLILTVGLATFRSWAREGAMGMFGIGGLAIGLLSFSGLSQGAPNAPMGLLAGVVLLVVAGLVASPSCARDWDRAERRRLQRKESKRRASAAR